jgi:SpoIID/LytB domain protein
LKLSFHEIESRIWRGIERDSPNRRFFPKSYLQNPERWYLMGVKTEADGALPVRMPAEALTAEAREKIQRDGAEGGHVRELVFSFVDRSNLRNKIKVAMNAYAARNWIDPARLKSTWFQVATLGRSVLFRGKGFGHGVGMCQWGAKSMGEKGFTRDEILKHYYPGVKIARISI